MLLNVTNYLVGNIRKNGQYQYLIIFASGGYSMRSIDHLNEITEVNRIINNSIPVKEAIDKAHSLMNLEDNNLPELKCEYKRLLA